MMKANDFMMFSHYFLLAVVAYVVESNTEELFIYVDSMDRETQFPEISEFADSHANETYDTVFHATRDSIIYRLTGHAFGYNIYN